MKTLDELTHIVAKNIVYYRKMNHMTQVDLAKKISYSDKAISKWERAEALPDVYILSLLSEVFGITVNELLKESSIEEIKNNKKRSQGSFIFNKVFISLLSSGLVLFISVALFAILTMIFPNEKRFWVVFIYAIPIISIIFIVFAKLYWTKLTRFIFISTLNWSIALSIFITLEEFYPIDYSWLLFIISAAFEILTIFWYLRKTRIKD